MNRKCSQILTLLLIAFVCLPPILAAQEPNFQWSFNGRPDDPSLVCVQINEPSEAPRFDWDDNFLCSDRDWGLQWSFNGEIDGMLCTQINEPSEPPRFDWDDNFLCVPLGSPLLLEWSFSGVDQCPFGFDFVQINEPSEQPGIIGGGEWGDNFLCFASDSDGDALPDTWEVSGLDVDGNGTIDVDLPALGAHPQRKDIFVEIDCLVNDGNGNGIFTDPQDHSHCPLLNAIGNVVLAFANAPVPNNDGTVGVQLHVDTGPLYGAERVMPVMSGGGVIGNFGDLRDKTPGGPTGGGDQIAEAGNRVIDWDGTIGRPATNFYDIKNANFNSSRELVFRYALFAHQTISADPCTAINNDCTSGSAEDIPANDFMITLGGTNANGDPCWTTDANGFSVGSTNQQAGTFMHELGHALGFGHGGGDGVNFKPNYLSVMSYAFQSCRVPGVMPPPVADGVPILTGGCDYSPITFRSLDETNLDECFGIGPLFGPTNWDGDRILEGATCMPSSANVIADINGDDTCVVACEDVKLATKPSPDDKLDKVDDDLIIVDGPDRTCNTTAVADDIQVRAVGEMQPNPLNGFNDWASIVYNFRTHDSFANGVANPVEDEPNPEIIERAREFMAQQMAPDVQVEKSGPADVLPGETITYSVEVLNTGRGPALMASLDDKLPDGSVETISLNTIQASGEGTETAAITKTVEFDVPADACPQTLVNEATVTFKDFVGNPGTVTDFVSTRVLDVTPPELSVADVTVECTAVTGTSVALGTPVTSDSCDLSVAVQNDAPALFPLGSTAVTWTATDDSGNESTAIQTVTVSVSVVCTKGFIALLQADTEAAMIPNASGEGMLAALEKALNRIMEVETEAAGGGTDRLEKNLLKTRAQMQKYIDFLTKEKTEVASEVAASLLAAAKEIITQIDTLIAGL